MVRRRLTISIDADLDDELRARVPAGAMSAWFCDAARERLEREADAALVGAATAGRPEEDLAELRALREGSATAASQLPWSALRSKPSDDDIPS